MDDQLHRLSNALSARYAIQHALGFGGMATVYLAHDVKHDRNVAVKVLRPELAAVLGGERFLNEIKVTANLQHPNILPLFDSGEADSFLYYVMPYVEGGSLRSLVERKKQLAIEQAVELVSKVAMALDYAHRQGVIHRDIKPENILLHENQPLIADFGIALAVSAAGGERLTETGLSLGTPQYMSPEQASGDRHLDPASDVYSLGCVLYELLAGDPPHLGSTAQAIIARIVTETPTRISLLRDTVPPQVEDALNRALAKAPADRFDSAAAFATALSTPANDVKSSRKSIVVLPFADLSPDSDNEYFSDGLTEEIIADLSKLRALRVISRTSAMQLKGTTKDTRTIGRELNCQYVLEGSVRKAGDRLRITAQLIDAESDAHVWAEKYNGVLEDVFDVQEQVSRSIADALAVELSPEEERHIAERPIPNMVAYDHYLRARQGLSQFTAAGLDDAIVHLQKGLDIVGENALLYRGMGYVHVQYVNAQIDVSPNHLVEAERYASKIEALDPTSTDIPFLQGLVAIQRGQLHEAVRKLSRAYEGNPTDPDIMLWLSIILAFAGLMQKARRMAQQLEDIDPFGQISPVVSPWLTFLEGRFAQSAAEMQPVYAADPGNMILTLCYAHILGAARKTEEVSKVVTEAMRRDPDAAMTKGIVVFRHALRGEVDEVHRFMTDELETMLGGDWHWCHLIADCYALIDNSDLALNWLEKAIDMGYTNYPFLSEYDPFFDSIRQEPRFADLMARVKRESEVIRAEIGD